MNVKKFIFSFGVFILIAGIFDMLCFWLVSDYTTSFYISIAFMNGSILVLACSSLLMARKNRFIYVSLLDGSVISAYTVISTILNFCFAIFRMNDVQVNIRVNVIILVVYLIALFIVYANTSSIIEQSKHDAGERGAYYAFKDKAEELLGKGSNIRVNKHLEFLYDKICSCQINRTANVSDIDTRILTGLLQLQVSLEDKADETVIVNRIDNVISLVEERNRRIVNALKR